MKKSRFTEAQIVGILKELDSGTPVTELARKHGIHVNTIRLWRTVCRPASQRPRSASKKLESETRRCDGLSPGKPWRSTRSRS